MAQRPTEAPTPPVKPWYASRTIWANVVGAAAGITASYGLDLGLTPETQGAIVLGILGVVNVIMRAVTSTGIGKG